LPHFFSHLLSPYLLSCSSTCFFTCFPIAVYKKQETRNGVNVSPLHSLDCLCFSSSGIHSLEFWNALTFAKREVFMESNIN
jgi:hypothetical protein